MAALDLLVYHSFSDTLRKSIDEVSAKDLREGTGVGPGRPRVLLFATRLAEGEDVEVAQVALVPIQTEPGQIAKDRRF